MQGELGSGNFRGQTFIRTRTALDVVMDGFVVDCYLLVGALVLSVLIGSAAGVLQATRPSSAVSRTIALVTVFALSAPVYWLGLVVLLLFAPGVGSVAEVPFVSTINGYRDPFEDPLGFVRTARGKGVTQRRVVWRRALPPAAGPVVTLVASNVNLMLTNVALIEPSSTFRAASATSVRRWRTRISISPRHS